MSRPVVRAPLLSDLFFFRSYAYVCFVRIPRVYVTTRARRGFLFRVAVPPRSPILNDDGSSPRVSRRRPLYVHGQEKRAKIGGGRGTLKIDNNKKPTVIVRVDGFTRT